MFTSSSNAAKIKPRPPDKPWLAGWIAVLLLTGGVVGGTELCWRNRGCRPDVPDTPELWNYWRNRVDERDGRVVVLLGTSRMQADLCVDTLGRQCPLHQVAQLSVFGFRSPIGTLEDLSRDAAFRGLVVCEMLPPYLERSRWADQHDYYDAQPESQQLWNTVALSWLQSQLVVLNPQYSLSQALVRISQRQSLPDANYKRQTFNRDLQYDFSKLDDVQFRRAQGIDDYRDQAARLDVSALAPDAAEFDAVNRMVERIRGRGGDVVFVRLPSSGDRLAFENELYPRHEWDRLAANVAAGCIHFQDIEALSRFTLPDGSHLDAADSAGFTRALVGELRRRRIIE